MSESYSEEGAPEYRPINSRSPSDPDSFYRGGVLYITVFPREKAAVELTPFETTECQERAVQHKKTVDSLIQALKLKKAGDLKYQKLKATRKLPPAPACEAAAGSYATIDRTHSGYT